LKLRVITNLSVVVHINGKLLTDPVSGNAHGVPKDSTAQVAVGFTLGTLYHLRQINIDVDGERRSMCAKRWG